MREIKFRAWDKERKEMLMPEQICHLDGNVTKGIKEFAPFLELKQFIGLKDKNGKEIFEGDIINICTKESGIVDENKQVRVEYLCAFINLDCGLEAPLYDFAVEDRYYFEVVGNIHENPELLK